MEVIRLYCFPFAAGSCYSYQPLVQSSPAGVQWLPQDYPGRGRRLFEPLVDQLDRIVDDALARLRPQLAQPFAFFGHSMGSLVAYRLSCRLMAENLPLPRHLILSGRGGACIPEKQRNAQTMSRPEIIEEVTQMGGDLSGLLRQPRAWDRYEQELRADLTALEQYQYRGPARLPMPATVLIGDHDLYTPAEAGDWQREFIRPIDRHVLPGNHFFLFEHGPFIHACIHRTFVSTNADASV